MIVREQDFTEVLEYLDKHDKLAVDTETTGLRYHDRLFSVQFATQDRSFYFDRRALANFDRVKGLFDRERTWYAQNAKFDMRMLSWEKMVPKGTVSDLEVLVRLDRNDVMSTRLADTARREGMEKLKIVDDYIKEHELHTKITNKYGGEEKLLHFDRVPIEIMGQYAHHDTRITYDLSEKILSRLDPKCFEVYKNECALTPICLEMEMGGALLDLEYTRNMYEYESGLIREAKNEFLLVTGKLYDTSKQTLIEIFTKAGEVIPTTAKGNPSLTDDILEGFTSPAARILQKIRHYEKRISTYYSSFLDLCDDHGYIHPDMRQAGTKTGRFSYRDPNLQNIPKEDDKDDLTRPNLVRRCFVPEKDHVLVSMDYSQQEYRLMLAYADQRDLIEQVMAGVDLHEATARLVGITRKQAKTLNFAILYGAGDDKLAWMLGITKQEASLLRKRYFMALPMVLHLISQVKRTVASRGHVYNWYGRKLCLPGNVAAGAYAVPNHLIQGGGADICKVAMVQVAPEIKGTGIRMQKQVHDQLLFQVPKDQFDKLPRIKEIMEGVFPEKNGMRMKVDVSWSDKSFAEADMKKGFPA
jgi:DNA polymerase-1